MESSSSASPLQKEEGLNRTIGVWGLSANSVNIIVGAGIFILPAIVAAGLGSASLVAYLFFGLLPGLIMLCFAEAGSEVTESGGPYTYIESAFGKYAGFMTANLFLIAILAAIVILWFLSHLTVQEAFGIAFLVAVLTGVFFGMQWMQSLPEEQQEKSPAINEIK